MSDATVLQRLEAMRDDMQGIRNSMTQIAEAITRLAVLEEKHQGVATTVTRLSNLLDNLEKRVYQAELGHNIMQPFVKDVKDLQERVISIEKAEAVKAAKTEGQIQGVTWTAKAFWAVFGGAVGYVALTLLKLAAPLFGG